MAHCEWFIGRAMCSPNCVGLRFLLNAQAFGFSSLRMSFDKGVLRLVSPRLRRAEGTGRGSFRALGAILANASVEVCGALFWLIVSNRQGELRR